MRWHSAIGGLLVGSYLVVTAALLNAYGPTEPCIKAFPIKVSDGPLLMFTRTEETRKVPGFDDGVYLFNPVTDREPARAFQSTAYISPEARIDRHRLVLFGDNRLWVADLAAGSVEAVFADRCAFFRGMDGSRVYFEEDPRLPKDRADSSKQTVFDWHRLWALETQGNQRPKLLWDQRFTDIIFGLGGPSDTSGWFSTKQHFWVIVTEPPAIWRIAKNGQDHHGVIALDKTMMPGRRGALSPNGRYLALPVNAGLNVWDVTTGTTICTLKNIPIRVHSFSSSTASLEFTWLDDRRLRYSETVLTKPDERFPEGYFQWVDVDVHTKKRLQTRRYSERLELGHTPPSRERPSPGRRFRQGLFDFTDGNLFYLNAKEPIRPAQTKEGVWAICEACISSDGRWAAFYDRNDDCLYVADGAKRRLQKIYSGHAHGLSWLPPTE